MSMSREITLARRAPYAERVAGLTLAQAREGLTLLPHREWMALACWLDGGTFTEVGALFSVTNDRARQIVRAALTRIKENHHDPE